MPVFPNRDRGTPSPTVLLVKIKETAPYGLTPGVLPFPVEWRQWRTAVVPVLEDDRWRVRGNPLNEATLRVGGVGDFLGQIGKALRVAFEDAGWGS